MASKYNWKTVLKILSIAVIFVFLVATMALLIDKPANKILADRINIHAISINEEESSLRARVKMPRVKVDKLKVNGVSQENKGREFMINIPLYKTNDWPFYTYEYNLNIEDAMTRFRYIIQNAINNIKITEYNIRSDSKSITFTLILWACSIIFSLMLLVLVGEIWLRKRGGTILQLIFSLFCSLFVFTCDKIIDKVTGSFFVDNFVSKWSLICSSVCTCLLFGIFIFRIYNEKFVNGERTDNAAYKQVSVI